MMVGIWGAGLIGRSLAVNLTESGVPVCMLNRSIEKVVHVAGSALPMRQMSFSASEDEMAATLQGLSVLVHCAGSVSDDHDEFEKAATRAATAAIKAGVSRVVMLSTVAVYGNAIEDAGLRSGTIVAKSLQPLPVTPYARSRYRAELSMRDLLDGVGVEFAVVRIPMVLGRGMTARPFAKLRLMLDVGLFPALGSSSASLPCIRSERLAQGLARVATQVEPIEQSYQFSECLRWSSVLQSYMEKTAKKVHRVVLPGHLIYQLITMVRARRLGLILKSMMNEAIYLDDSAALISTGRTGKPCASYLNPDAALSDILWPTHP